MWKDTTAILIDFNLLLEFAVTVTRVVLNEGCQSSHWVQATSICRF
jgi:hypothetical protein